MTYNSWKKDASDRRDEKNIKIDDDRHRTRGKKNRKRWCGGHEGREHDPKCMRYNDAHPVVAQGRGEFSDRLFFMRVNWFILVCSKCGKELDHCYGHHSKVQPDWVKSFLEREREEKKK